MTTITGFHMRSGSMRKESNIRPYPIPQALSRPSSLVAVGRDLSPRGHPDPSPLIVILIHSTSLRTRASEGSRQAMALSTWPQTLHPDSASYSVMPDGRYRASISSSPPFRHAPARNNPAWQWGTSHMEGIRQVGV